MDLKLSYIVTGRTAGLQNTQHCTNKHAALMIKNKLVALFIISNEPHFTNFLPCENIMVTNYLIYVSEHSLITMI